MYTVANLLWESDMGVWYDIHITFQQATPTLYLCL